MQRCYFWQFFSYTIGIWEKVHAYITWLTRMCVLCINANCLFQNTVVTNSYVWKYLLLIWWVYKFMTSLNLCCNHSHYFYRCKPLQKTKKNSSIPMSTYFSNGSKQLLPWLTHRQKEILNWKMKLHKFNLNKSYCVFILSVNFLTTWFIVSW
jgi:hypothetical protein